jgi:hypothetical protein
MIRLNRVDLPTLGRPTIAISGGELTLPRSVQGWCRIVRDLQNIGCESVTALFNYTGIILCEFLKLGVIEKQAIVINAVRRQE